MTGSHSRRPISDDHVALGRELLRLRKRAGKTLRELGGFTPGHLSSVENGYEPASRAVVEHYLREVGGDRGLVLNLLDVAQRRSARRRSKTRAAEGAELDGADDQGKPYVIDAEDAFYRLTDRGSMAECLNSFEIRAIRAGVTGYERTVTYEADKRRGVIRIEAQMGCEISRIEEDDTGALRFLAEFGRELDPLSDEAYCFAYRTPIRSDKRAFPVVANQTHATRIHRVTHHLQFTPPALPRSIWWFACPTFREISVPRPDRILTLNSSGYYFHSFLDLLPRWFYGLAWVWEE
jgi:hypothetical protein